MKKVRTNLFGLGIIFNLVYLITRINEGIVLKVRSGQCKGDIAQRQHGRERERVGGTEHASTHLILSATHPPPTHSRLFLHKHLSREGNIKTDTASGLDHLWTSTCTPLAIPTLFKFTYHSNSKWHKLHLSNALLILSEIGSEDKCKTFDWNSACTLVSVFGATVLNANQLHSGTEEI